MSSATGLFYELSLLKAKSGRYISLALQKLYSNYSVIDFNLTKWSLSYLEPIDAALEEEEERRVLEVGLG